MSKRHTAGPDLISQIRRCQELILARSGVDDFFETIKLIVAKALHDEEKSNISLHYNDAEEILNKNQDLVRRFIEGEAKFLAPPEVIEECLQILQSARLNDISFEVLDAAFEAMTAKNAKSDKGQFFTPRHVVNFCIEVLSPNGDEIICDPACGSGAFLKAAYDYIGKKNNLNLFGFDISPRAAKTAELMSFLGCGDLLKISQLDALNLCESSLLPAVETNIEGVLKKYHKNFSGFDLIATNPPFAGDVSNASYAIQYELGRIRGRIERDALFIERCLKLLKPGGRMAIVLPDNKISASKYANVREWILRNGKICAVVSLHSYTFRPYTSQKAAVLFIQRWNNNEAITANYPISMFRSDRPGKTSAGNPILIDGAIDHDLSSITQTLKDIWKK